MKRYKIFYDTENDRRTYGLLDIKKNFNNYDIDILKEKLINKFTDFKPAEYDQVELEYHTDEKYSLIWYENDKLVGLTFILTNPDYEIDFINPRTKIYYEIE